MPALNELAQDIILCAAAVILALLLRRFVFKIVRVRGTSMLDTLRTGDGLYVSVLTKNIRGYKRGDIVICRFPGRKGYFVKRLIGLPGERVELKSGQVLINDVPLDEPYVTHGTVITRPPITLPQGAYYVLGDNRRVSHDSHSADVGPVTSLCGAVRAVIWPLKRRRRL